MIPASQDGKALLFVDPRYSIQARQEVVKGLWEVRDVLTGQGSTGWIGWAIKVSPEDAHPTVMHQDTNMRDACS